MMDCEDLARLGTQSKNKRRNSPFIDIGINKEESVYKPGSYQYTGDFVRFAVKELCVTNNCLKERFCHGHVLILTNVTSHQLHNINVLNYRKLLRCKRTGFIL